MKGLLKRTMMVLTIATILAVGLFLSALTVHATSERPMYTKQAMKVYEKRSKSSKVVKKNLSKNKKVIVYGSAKNGWVEITCPDGTNGYVKKADLTTKKPAGVSAQGSGSEEQQAIALAKQDYTKLKKAAIDNGWEVGEAPDFKTEAGVTGAMYCAFEPVFYKDGYNFITTHCRTYINGSGTHICWWIMDGNNVVERYSTNDNKRGLQYAIDALSRY